LLFAVHVGVLQLVKELVVFILLGGEDSEVDKGFALRAQDRASKVESENDELVSGSRKTTLEQRVTVEMNLSEKECQ
jgi:hypothetical protein